MTTASGSDVSIPGDITYTRDRHADRGSLVHNGLN